MKIWLRYFVGPAAAQIDHRAGVGVAAAGGVGAVVAGVRRVADPMPMDGDGLDVVVGVGIEVLARLPLVAAALNHVIQVRNHAGRAERPGPWSLKSTPQGLLVPSAKTSNSCRVG